MVSYKEHLNIRISGITTSKTNHPIIAFDCDDWGVSATKNQGVLLAAERDGFCVKGDPSIELDTIESYEDIRDLSEMIGRHSDSEGNHPTMTLNFMMFNPDFEAMLHNNFASYCSTPFYKAYGDNDSQKKIISLFLEKKKTDIFDFQLHGAEHMNVPVFMRQARAGDKYVTSSSKYGLISFSGNYYRGVHHLFDELGSLKKKDIDFSISRLEEARSLFKSVFGFYPIAFTPACGVICSGFFAWLKLSGFQYIKTSPIDWRPDGSLFVRHINISKKRSGLNVICRPVSFEPSIRKDEGQRTFNCIKECFEMKQPCVVSTHRVDFVSGIKNSVKQEGLRQFDFLLSKLEKEYPDIEFKSTNDLYLASHKSNQEKI
jgi:hypothetical protein